ncbi:MAG TPA: VCBS repeat-containing protein [Myxococcaceae bacterium]
MMRKRLPWSVRFILGSCLLAVTGVGCSQAQPVPPPPAGQGLRFEKRVLDTAFRAEGVTVVDFDVDGDRDVLAGAVAYVAPEWSRRELIAQQPLDPATQFSEAFAVFSGDFGPSGRQDLIVVAFPLGPARWLQLQPPGTQWATPSVADPASTESPLFLRLPGSARPSLVFTRGRDLVAASFDGGTVATRVLATAPGDIPGHGLGYGDINGDGRNDFLTIIGVFLASDGAAYRFVPADLGPDCAQMHVFDVDEDGRADVVSSSAHAKGVFWHRQQAPVAGEDRLVFTRSIIDDSFSQSHALELADLTGDGRPELITGKRRWAHGPQGDVDPDAPAVLYAFEARRASDGTVTWVRHELDPEQDSGVGTQFEVTDVDGDGLKDIVTANKEGVFLFRRLSE